MNNITRKMVGATSNEGFSSRKILILYSFIILYITLVTVERYIDVHVIQKTGLLISTVFGRENHQRPYNLRFWLHYF